MDIAIIRELFPHCIAAAELLNIDTAFRARLQTTLDHLPPYRISSQGYLQEWIEDWKPAPAGHNVSPNFTIYPGHSIRLHRDTALAAAISRWMTDHPARGGFPASWDIAVWARLERGDKTAESIRSYIGHSPAPDLHNGGSNQSDASFGYTAAVAECLLQSQDGELCLLPAIPVDWTNGSVTGLRARGGFTVSIHWTDGQMDYADITRDSLPVTRADLPDSRTVTSCRIRYRQTYATLLMNPGQKARLTLQDFDHIRQ